jgi:DNA (cytosine-5)-methyltransferase 1
MSVLAHIDLFSGIGGFGLGLESVARTAAWSEIERNACDVMRYRCPGAVELGDIRGVTAGKLESISDRDEAIVTAGSPCQDLSIANTVREGFDGDRSGLFREYARVLAEYQPAWTIWENVPGALTSNGGRDFGTVLWSLAHSGYRLAWRVVDLRDLGIPQRRKRIILVGRRADAPGLDPCQILDLCPGCGRHPRAWLPERDVAAGGAGKGAARYGMTVFVKGRRAQSVTDHETWVGGGEVVSPTLNLFDNASETRSTILTIGTDGKARRLPPQDHEALMALPVDWTRTGRTLKGDLRTLPDSSRYRLCGNAVSPAQIAWFADRIQYRVQLADVSLARA